MLWWNLLKLRWGGPEKRIAALQALVEFHPNHWKTRQALALAVLEDDAAVQQAGLRGIADLVQSKDEQIRANMMECLLKVFAAHVKIPAIADNPPILPAITQAPVLEAFLRDFHQGKGFRDFTDVLLKVGDTDALKHLLAFLRRAAAVEGSSNLSLTNWAVGVINDLAKRKETRVLPGLIKILQEGHNAHVRGRIAEMLPEFGDARVAAVLQKTLGDGESEVREAAHRALKGLDWEPADDEQRIWKATLDGHWDQVAQYGPAAIPALLGVLARTDVEAWLQVLPVLGRLGDVQAVVPILLLLKDMEAFSRRVPDVLEEAIRPTAEINETTATAMLKPIKDLYADIEGDKGRIGGLVSRMMMGLMQCKFGGASMAVVQNMLMPFAQVVIHCGETLKQINQSAQALRPDPALQRTVEQADALTVQALTNLRPRGT